MKKYILSLAAVATLASAGSASAFWGSDNNWECYGPYGKIPGCNPYDEWDPRYWMEEMSDVWDDDDYYGRPFGMGMPYGYGAAPYGAPYGAPAPMPYGYPQVPPAPAPAPVK